LPALSHAVNESLVQEANAFLHHVNLSIDPRKQWPDGGMPHYGFGNRARIKPEHRAQPGRALCAWGDAGWGSSVRQGKYHDGRFDDALVSACVTMIREWNPQPAPTWVTCIPSRRHAHLVPDFAQRLAQALQLPFHGVIEKTGNRPEQKTMNNSAQQARNLDGSLAIRQDQAVPAGPVLLVDDMVDSRWTLTVAAWLLRQNGSGEVWPMALSRTGHDE
jgi:ATP-dependent DNA helicase RecQ